MRLFTKPYPKKQFARQLHRLLAYSVALLLAWFSLTGIALNHSDDLKLKDIQIQHPWLLSWYQIEPPKIKQAFQLNEDWLIQTQQTLYWNNTPLPTQGSIRFLVKHDAILWILLPNHLMLLTDTGDFIERIPLPPTLRSENTTTQADLSFYQWQQQRIIATQNHQAWLISDDLTELKAMDIQSKTEWRTISSIKPQAAPTVLQQNLMKTFNSPLTLEKIMLELHNGYLFGSLGPWLVDLSALLFILMVISGIRLHLR